MIYLRLAFEFFKTGLFAIGGGLATLPFLYDIAERTGWYTARDISDMIAVSESTPGPMGINMATYVGFHVGGVPGALVATLSLVLPSVIIVILVARVLRKFQSSRIVQSVMYGIRPASVALITYAGLLVARIALLYTDRIEAGADLLSWVNWKGVLLGGAVLFAFLKWKKHPIVYVLAAGVIGALFRF